MIKKKMKPSKIAALTGVMAAVYYVFLWLPGIPAIGIPKVKIDLGASFAPILGLLLGPYLGFLAALLGDLVKVYTPPSVHGLPFVLCPPVSAFAAGYITRGKWKIPFILLIILLVASMFTPVFYPITSYGYIYLWGFFDKIIALILIPISAYLVKKNKKPQFHIALFLAMFIGNETDATLGNLVFSLPIVYEGIFGVPSAEVVRGLFTLSPLVYPAIRLIQAFIGYIIALPLLKVLSRITVLREFIQLKEFEGKV